MLGGSILRDGALRSGVCTFSQKPESIINVQAERASDLIETEGA